MSNLSSPQSPAAASAAKCPGRSTLRATRYECEHCQTHTFLVLPTIGEATCRVCESHDLVPVAD